ncbi:hypothetical protein HMPREF9538_04581 [Klebsiella sp. MS 92-3]|nr:hypothetical protein HMPREF9538_04581 [Klebsiella sp. MS 92-3]
MRNNYFAQRRARGKCYPFYIFTMNVYRRKKRFCGGRYYSDVIKTRADMSTR